MAISLLTRAASGSAGAFSVVLEAMAERVDRLRREADMRHHGDAALGQKRDGLRHAPAALELDGAATGLLEDARRRHEGLLPRRLIGTERHVDHDQRALRAAHHGVALQDHHVERHRHRALEPVHHHAERVADQDHVAMLVEDARGVRMIGGERDDRLAALAGADVGRGEAPLLGMGRHLHHQRVRTEHRDADE
jgi:hypothetical protein